MSYEQDRDAAVKLIWDTANATFSRHAIPGDTLRDMLQNYDFTTQFREELLERIEELANHQEVTEIVLDAMRSIYLEPASAFDRRAYNALSEMGFTDNASLGIARLVRWQPQSDDELLKLYFSADVPLFYLAELEAAYNDMFRRVILSTDEFDDELVSAAINEEPIVRIEAITYANSVEILIAAIVPGAAIIIPGIILTIGCMELVRRVKRRNTQRLYVQPANAAAQPSVSPQVIDQDTVEQAAVAAAETYGMAEVVEVLERGAPDAGDATAISDGKSIAADTNEEAAA